MKRYLEEFNRRTSLKERIRLLVDAMEEATGMQNMGAYLTTLFEIDNESPSALPHIVACRRAFSFDRRKITM